MAMLGSPPVAVDVCVGVVFARDVETIFSLFFDGSSLFCRAPSLLSKIRLSVRESSSIALPKLFVRNCFSGVLSGKKMQSKEQQTLSEV